MSKLKNSKIYSPTLVQQGT